MVSTLDDSCREPLLLRQRVVDRLNDIDAAFIDKRLAFIDKTLSRNVEKGRITEDEKQEALARLFPSTDLQDADDVDFVVEVVSLFRQAFDVRILRLYVEKCRKHEV